MWGRGEEGEFSAAATRSHEKLQTSLSFLMCECVCVCVSAPKHLCLQDGTDT